MTVRATVLDPSKEVNHLSKVIWELKIITTEFIRSTSSTTSISSLWRTLKSPKTITLAVGLTKRTSSVLDNIESIPVKTIPVFVLTDGEASWLLLLSLVSLLSGSTVQQENTYPCILKVIDQVWDRITISFKVVNLMTLTRISVMIVMKKVRMILM